MTNVQPHALIDITSLNFLVQANVAQMACQLTQSEVTIVRTLASNCLEVTGCSDMPFRHAHAAQWPHNKAVSLSRHNRQVLTELVV